MPNPFDDQEIKTTFLEWAKAFLTKTFFYEGLKEPLFDALKESLHRELSTDDKISLSVFRASAAILEQSGGALSGLTSEQRQFLNKALDQMNRVPGGAESKTFEQHWKVMLECAAGLLFRQTKKAFNEQDVFLAG